MKHRDPFVLRIAVLSFLFFCILFSKAGLGQAATAVWAMTSNLNATTTGNVTATTTTGGSGLTGYASPNGTCGAYSTNWPSTATLSSTKYAQFTVSPNTGYSLTAMTFKVHTYGATSCGTCCSIGGIDEVIEYSLNGFTSAGTIFAGINGPSDTLGDDGACGSTQDSYTLNGGTGVTVPNGGTLTIRLYGFAFNTTSDRLYIENAEIDGTTTLACSGPTITSFSPPSACSGSGGTITINGANYVNGSTTVTINGTAATPVTFVTTGQVTVPLPAGASGTGNIVVTTSCSAVTSSTTFAVTTAPATPGAISGHVNACSGGLDTFSVAAVSGATSYSWTLPGGWTGTSATDTIIGTVGSSGTVSVTADNVCNNSAAQTLAVTVTNGLPATPGTISGTTTACSGSLDTFSVAAVTGATSYTWSLPGGWTGTSTTDTIITTVGPSAGPVSVTANNACGSSAAATLPVTVNTVPATPGSIFGTATECLGALDTFGIQVVSGATSYTWSLPGGWTIVDSTSTLVFTAITATAGSSGTVSVRANNTCGSSAAQTFPVTVTTIPATPGPITGHTPACTGSLDTFSVTAVGGATIYTWTLPGGWTGTSTTNSIVATAGATAGTVTVTAGNSCGTSSAATLAVTVNSAPATPGTVSGTATFCSGNRDTFSVAAVTGATSYTWALPNGWTGTSTTNTIMVTAGSSAGSVSVTANNACGSSAAATLAVTANSAPATPGTVFGEATECSGALDTFAILAVTGATSYTWSLPGGWTTTGSTINAITGNAGSSGTVSVTANNACGSSAAATFAVTVITAPATPGAITSMASGCSSGSLDTFSVTAVNGATSYLWTLPNGWTGTSTTNTIIATQGATGGNVTVVARNACGSSSAQTLAVTIGTAPATPGAISGHASVCSSGSLDTFSVAAVNGATSYTWTLPNGWTGTSTTNRIIATTGANAGNVTVVANSNCGNSAAQTLAVTTGTAPATPGIITSTASGCNGGSIDTFSVAVVNGATSYTWTLPGGWTGTSATNTIITTVGTSGGTVSVTANSTCGSSAASTLAVTVGAGPGTPGTISGITVVCGGGLDTFSIAPVSGATSYTWTLPSGWTGTSTTSTIIATTGSTAGYVTVVARNSCGASAASSLPVSTTTQAPPTPGPIGGPTTICAGGRDSFYVSPVSRTSSYTWTLPSGWTGTSTTNSIIAIAGSTGGVISVTAENGCGTSAAQTITDTVGAAPTVVFDFLKNPVCNNHSTMVTLNMATPPGGTYSGPGVTGNTFNAAVLNAGNYVLTYTYSVGGCSGSDTANFEVVNCTGIENAEGDQITVYPNPFTDAITIHTDGSYGSGVAILTDATGREVRRTDFSAGAMTVQVNTASLAGGLYMLSISVEGKLITVKKLVRTE